MRISDWSSDVCSSDLPSGLHNIEGHLDFARCERVLGSKQAQKPRRIVPIALVRGARLLRFAVGAPAALLIKIVETDPIRSEERREGKEGVSTCRSRWSRDHSKKKQKTTYLEIK